MASPDEDLRARTQDIVNAYERQAENQVKVINRLQKRIGEAEYSRDAALDENKVLRKQIAELQGDK